MSAPASEDFKPAPRAATALGATFQKRARVGPRQLFITNEPSTPAQMPRTLTPPKLLVTHDEETPSRGPRSSISSSAASSPPPASLPSPPVPTPSLAHPPPTPPSTPSSVASPAETPPLQRVPPPAAPAPASSSSPAPAPVPPPAPARASSPGPLSVQPEAHEDDPEFARFREDVQADINAVLQVMNGIAATLRERVGKATEEFHAALTASLFDQFGAECDAELEGIRVSREANAQMRSRLRNVPAELLDFAQRTRRD